MPYILDINHDKVHVDGTDDEDQDTACDPPASVKRISTVIGRIAQPLHKQKKTLCLLGSQDRSKWHLKINRKMLRSQIRLNEPKLHNDREKEEEEKKKKHYQIIPII